MAAKTIPENIQEIILDLAGKGKSVRAIADALVTLHGYKTSHMAVQRCLKELRQGRAEVAKAVVREELAPVLTNDLRRLERFAKKCANRAARCADDVVFTKLVDELRKITETKLKFSGADEPDQAAAAKAVIFIPPDSDD